MDEFVRSWQRPFATVMAWLIIGVLVKLAIWTFGPKIIKPNVRPPWVTLLSSVIRGYLVLWFALAGLGIALRMAPLASQEADWAGKVALALFLGSVTLAASVYATRLARHYGPDLGLQVSTTSLTLNLVRIPVVVLGLLIILSNLGISITPLLTALGVGSLAVALAIQDTLSNFFSGFNIIASKHVGVGDHIKIENGAEGIVEDIAWRSCRLRDAEGNTVIVPNNKLAQSVVTVITNHSRKK